MTSLWDNSVSTSLADRAAQTSIDPRTRVQLRLLREAPLKNEEIIELIAFLCNAESIDMFKEHITILRDRYDLTVDTRPVELEVLSLRDKFTLPILRNFYRALGDVGYHGMIPQIITLYQQDRAASVYIQNLETVFGIQPDEEFVRATIKYIDDSELDGPGVIAIRRYYQDKLDRISGYAPIPTYIRDFGIQVNELPHLKEKEVSADMPSELIAQYLIEQMANYDLYVEETDGTTAKDVFTSRIESMTNAEREAFVVLFKVDPEEVKRIQTNRDVFRVYGPVNPYLDTDFSNLRNEETGELDVNLIFGGARMFTDMALEYDPETGVPLDDWFTGYCLQCSKRIRAYHHAVREPVLQGGWRGCYCNWDCVRDSIRPVTEQDTDTYNMYVLQMALIKEMENAINDIGIQDRDYEEPEEGQDVNQDNIQDIISKMPTSPPANTSTEVISIGN
jgi:hypothetical protein